MAQLGRWLASHITPYIQLNASFPRAICCQFGYLVCMETSTNETIFKLLVEARKARATGDFRLADILRDKAVWIASVSREGASR